MLIIAYLSQTKFEAFEANGQNEAIIENKITIKRFVKKRLDIAAIIVHYP